MRICEIEGCGAKHKAKGKCLKHYRATWYVANKERHRAQHRARYAANKERSREQSRAYYAANRERGRAQRRAYHAATKERAHARSKAWYAANREMVAAYQARNRDHRTRLLEYKRARHLAVPPSAAASMLQRYTGHYYGIHIESNEIPNAHLVLERMALQLRRAQRKERKQNV